MKDSPPNNGQSDISACYMLPSIYNWKLTRNDPPEIFRHLETTRFSVRFKLQSGYSAVVFENCFYEKLRETAKKLSDLPDISVKDVAEKATFYTPFGNSDALMISDLPLALLLPLYLQGGILNPGDDFFKKYIVSIRSTVIIPNEKPPASYALEFSDSDRSKTEMRIEKLRLEWDEVLASYKNFRLDNKLQTRMYMALKNSFLHFDDLIRSPHAFDLLELLLPVFESLKKNMQQSHDRINFILALESQSPGLRSGGSNGHRAEWLIDAYNEAMRIFRELVGTYLTDLSHSDRFFIEGNQLEHPSIGSATKLMSAYNQIVNATIPQISTSSDRSYTFLIVSGGCDRSKAHNLFDYLGTSILRNGGFAETRLLVVQLPEMSLFDVRGTLFRIFHEMFHYVGERHRKLRYQKAIELSAIFLANQFADFLEFRGVEEISQFNNIPGIDQESFKADLKEISHRYAQIAWNKMESYFKAQLAFWVSLLKSSDRCDDLKELFYTQLEENLELSEREALQEEIASLEETREALKECEPSVGKWDGWSPLPNKRSANGLVKQAESADALVKQAKSAVKKLCRQYSVIQKRFPSFREGKLGELSVKATVSLRELWISLSGSLKDNEAYYYSRSIYQKISDAAEHMLLPDFYNQSSAFNYIYCKTEETVRDIYHELADKLRKYELRSNLETAGSVKKMSISNADMIYRTQSYYSDSASGSKGMISPDFVMEREGYNFLWARCEALLGNAVDIPVPGLEGAENTVWSNRLSEILYSAGNAMSEAFSDCLTIQALGVTLEDYLLCYIYEHWDVKQAFRLDVTHILRIGLVMETQFSLNNILDKEQKMKIKERCKSWVNKGWKERVNADELIDAVNCLLESYFADYRFPGLTKPLAEYLKDCVEHFDEKPFTYARAVYNSANMEPDAYTMTNSLLQCWMQLASPIKEDQEDFPNPADERDKECAHN